jgi:putative ABC transport system permease protein
MPVEVAGLDEAVMAGFRTVAPGYFEALRIPIVAGRDFGVESPAVEAGQAIVSEAFARHLGSQPIGRRINFEPGSDRSFEIVGIAGDVRHAGLGEAVEPEVFLTYDAYPMNWGYLVVRARSDPAPLVTAIRSLTAELDPGQPVYSIATLDSLVSASTADRRLASILTAVFGAIALVVLAGGVYVQVANWLAGRQHELAVRAAIGASGQALAGLAFRETLVPAGTGLALGLLCALTVERMLTAAYADLVHASSSVYGAACLTVTATALLAHVGPALRASRIAPSAVLRN